MIQTAATVSPPLQRGDVLDLDLLSWGRLGEAMATHDGRDVFVFGGIPGETVSAEVVAVRRKYVAAQVLSVTPRRRIVSTRRARISASAPDASGSTCPTMRNSTPRPVS